MIKLAIGFIAIISAGVTVGVYLAPTEDAETSFMMPPPVEAAAIAAPVTGEVVTLAPIYISTPKPPPPPPKPTQKKPAFFDFDRARCDEADAIHGRVLRCGR